MLFKLLNFLTNLSCRNIFFKIDDQRIKLTLKDVKLVGESYRLSMTSSQPDIGDEISVIADYFIELFPTQQNVLSLKHFHGKNYYIFKKGKEDFSFVISH